MGKRHDGGHPLHAVTLLTMASRARPAARALPVLPLVLFAAAVLAPSALSQQQVPASPGAPVRLLKAFARDGGIQPNVWLEGQWRMEGNAPLPDGNDGTRSSLSGLLALGFSNRVEFGLTWGGVTVEPDHAGSHSGMSDIEIYGKYRFRDAPIDISVGGLVKVPTADSGDLLGSGSTDWEGFAAVRKDFGAVQAIGSLGLRWNGDPDVSGVDGETSLLAGGGVIFELGTRSFGSLEVSYESRRYEGLSSDIRLTPGLWFRLGERGFFRAGLGLGLSDGAPDSELIAGFGWAY